MRDLTARRLHSFLTSAEMGSGMIASEVRMQGEAKVNAEEIATLHGKSSCDI